MACSGVSAGSVFAALPLNVGETIDDQALVQATRSLFKTGFFQDIQLGRDGNVLGSHCSRAPVDLQHRDRGQQGDLQGRPASRA
ncbi:putative outer membrane antigen [Pseudomonas aeruginosa]|nr:putative outer membrane antigen [Pseudomonas aeruginosa]